MFGLLAVGTMTQLVLARFGSRQVVTAGLALFWAALARILAALAAASTALFLAGTVVGGVAVGAVFLGSLATANRLAPPGLRAQTVSTFFVLCYAVDHPRRRRRAGHLVHRRLPGRAGILRRARCPVHSRPRQRGRAAAPDGSVASR